MRRMLNSWITFVVIAGVAIGVYFEFYFMDESGSNRDKMALRPVVV